MASRVASAANGANGANVKTNNIGGNDDTRSLGGVDPKVFRDRIKAGILAASAGLSFFLPEFVPLLSVYKLAATILHLLGALFSVALLSLVMSWNKNAAVVDVDKGTDNTPTTTNNNEEIKATAKLVMSVINPLIGWIITGATSVSELFVSELPREQ